MQRCSLFWSRERFESFSQSGSDLIGHALKRLSASTLVTPFNDVSSTLLQQAR